MQVLGLQNYPSQTHLHPQTHSTPKKTLVSQLNRYQNPNHFFSEKKKPINIKPNPIPTNQFQFEDFKQNHPKPTTNQQPDQSRIHTSHSNQIAPFSSVLNLKPQPKIFQPPRNIPKYPQSDVNKQQTNNQPPKRPKQETKKYIEKIIESKLNHMVQNKRKSSSFKVHPGHKQNPIRPQKRKQSYHVHQTKKQISPQYESLRQNQDKKQTLLNKQKNSISFIIRKKINSNVTQSGKNCERNGLNERLKSFQKEEFIKSQNSKYSCETNSFNANNTGESTLIKYSYKPMEGQLKKLRERQAESKDINAKSHTIKGMKCLKVRVNKVLKAQQQLFNEKYFPKQKNNQTIEQKKVEFSKNDWLQKDHLEESQNEKTLKKEVSVAVQFEERLITIEEILENQTRRQMPKTSPLPQKACNHSDSIRQPKLFDSQLSSNQKPVKPAVIVVRQKINQNQQFQGQQQKWKDQKIHETNPQTTNRKRISSIRAIKNYIKKMDTEHDQQKQSFATHEKQSKQETKTKKKDKQSAACLTHKIKWGTSKKKLNTDRFPPDPFSYPPPEVSIDSNKDHIKETSQHNNIMQKTPAKHRILMKAPTEIKLFNSPKAKTPSNKAEYLQEQFLKVKYQKTPKDKNLEKIFAQTINSKQFIDCDPIPFHTGSKSLIMFEDPGISMIINNNNSIHNPNYQMGFNTYPYQQFQNIQINDVSPVSMGKRRAYEMIEEKCEEEDQNPLQSLQELYFELKSRKELNPRIQSLEEICEG